MNLKFAIFRIMEEFLQDKIFQFYFHKIYGTKTNYKSFKSFTDKDKVSFLINLYLFISNINTNKNYNNENKSLINKGNQVNFNADNIKDNLYQDNYDKIMNEYTSILNKYNKEFHSKPINGINKYFKDQNKKNENNNDNSKKNNIKEKNEKNEPYLNDKLEYNLNIDTDNYFEEKKNQEDNEIIINSKRNDIDINIYHKKKFKSDKNQHIINTDSNNNKYNNSISYEYFQKQQRNNDEPEKDNNENKYNNIKTMENNRKNNILDISSRSYDKNNNSYINIISSNKPNINIP